MEAFAPKRRRVSPGASDPVASSERPISKFPPASLPRRPRLSFASPTTSNPPRHHSQNLEQQRSSSPSRRLITPSETTPRHSKDHEPRARDLAFNRTRKSNENVLASEPEQATDDLPLVDAADGAASERSTGRAKNLEGATVTPQKLSAIPVPRPLPPPNSEGEDEFDPLIRRTQRRAPITGINMPRKPEPELPPSVPDLVASTPPRGIHNSPSQWLEKDSKRRKKSSPLKPSPSRRELGLGLNKSLHTNGFPGQTASEDLPQKHARLDGTVHQARRVPAFDANDAKRKERDALRAEIARLKSDVEAAKRENERIRLMQNAGRIVTLTDERDMSELLSRSLISHEGPSAQSMSRRMAQEILHPSVLFPLRQPPLSIPFAQNDRDPDKDIKSHHPVTLNATEELPYLQLFSAFTVSSTVALLPPIPDQPLRQRHLLTLRTRDIPGIFSAKLEMVVDALSLSISELSVKSLEPAAQVELDPFIDKVCSGKCNRSMQQNVGILSWAMAEWCRTALQRARIWYRLEQQLGTKERILESAARRRSRRPRRRTSEPEADDEDDDDDNDDEVSGSCTMADLLRFMGQQAFEIRLPGPEGPILRLEWKIAFDWTGEAQSSTSLLVGVPGKWRKADQRGVFDKIPKLFEDLILRGMELEEAVHTVVVLLAGAQA